MLNRPYATFPTLDISQSPAPEHNLSQGLFKSFPIGERKRLDFRWEAFNAFNHPQFIAVPERNVFSTPASSFLNRDFTDSGIRTMWAQVKLGFEKTQDSQLN
jgi:hypothetical protein